MRFPLRGKRALRGILCGEASRNGRRGGRREERAPRVPGVREAAQALNQVWFRQKPLATAFQNQGSQVSFVPKDPRSGPYVLLTGWRVAHRNGANAFVRYTN